MSEEMKREITKIKSDVADLRSDMTGLRSDVTDLRSDVTGLRSDVTDLQSDMTDLRSVVKQVVTTLVRMDGRIERMSEAMVTRKDHAELISRMDGFTAQLEAGRFDWAKHQVRLDAHEKRLNRLEGRRS